jgi:hypothetical protein
MLTLPSRLVIQLRRYASTNVSHMVSNILPVPYHICHDEHAGDHVYHYPECFEKQCYPCFFDAKDRHSRTILIGVAHDMSCGPCPDAFDASYHGRLIQTAKARPANQATAITAYLIFLRRGILDQVLAMLFPVYLTYLFALQHHFDLCPYLRLNICLIQEPTHVRIL